MYNIDKYKGTDVWNDLNTIDEHFKHNAKVLRSMGNGGGSFHIRKVFPIVVDTLTDLEVEGVNSISLVKVNYVQDKVNVYYYNVEDFEFVFNVTLQCKPELNLEFILCMNCSNLTLKIKNFTFLKWYFFPDISAMKNKKKVKKVIQELFNSEVEYIVNMIVSGSLNYDIL